MVAALVQGQIPQKEMAAALVQGQILKKGLAAALMHGQKPQEISVATPNLLTVRSKDFKEVVTA